MVKNLGRPPKLPEERLVTLSVRIPKSGLELLDRVVEGEVKFLQDRGLPTRGVHKSAAFRAIWELGELEFVLQRVTLWLTRRNNRYTLEQAAKILEWDPDALRQLLAERGLNPPPTTTKASKEEEEPPRTKLDPRFLVE